MGDNLKHLFMLCYLSTFIKTSSKFNYAIQTVHYNQNETATRWKKKSLQIPILREKQMIHHEDAFSFLKLSKVGEYHPVFTVFQPISDN